MAYVINNTTDGLVERFDMDAYMDYRRASTAPSYNVDSPDHPLVGKKFSLNKDDDDDPCEVTIISAKRQWWAGYYYLGVYVTESGSHGTIVIENVNSICKDTIASCQRFRDGFTLIA